MSYQLLLLILPLITMPYISRVLGPNGFGTYSYTNSVMSYFVLFGSLGITLYGSRQIAYVQHNTYERSKTFFEITFLKIITTFISSIFLAIYLCVFAKYRLLIFAQSLTLLANAFDVAWYFMGIEDFKKNVVRNVVVKLISLFLIFILVKTKSDLLTYIIIMSGSTLFGNIVLIPFLRNQIVFVNIKKINIFQHLRPVLLLFLPQVATQIYLVVNKTMLGEMDSVTAVGYFSSSDTLVRLTLTIVSSLSAVLMPHISNLIAKNKIKSVEYYMKQSFEFINFLSLPIILGLLIISSKFIPLFLGNQFNIVSELVMIESPIILLISWSIAITNQYLIPSKMNKEYIISTILGAVSNIILNIILIKKFGVYGAIIATIISETTVMGYLVLTLKKHFNIRKMLFSNFFKYLFSSIVMFIVGWIIDRMLPTTMSAVILEIFISIMIYFVTLVLLKADIVRNWKSFFDDVMKE